MFSETYDVVDRYSLTSFNKVSTIDKMPRRFTYLANSRYSPVIDDDVKTVLNRIFDWKDTFSTTTAYHEFRNALGIENDGTNALLYRLEKIIPYKNVHGVKWNKFVSSIGLPKLHDCKEDIDKITGDQDLHATYITGFTVNPDGTLNGIEVYDTSYELDDYSGNDFLRRVNLLAKYRNKDSAKGTVTFHPDEDFFKYRLYLAYPEYIDNNYQNKDINRTIDAKDMIRDMYFEWFSRQDPQHNLNLFTQEQLDFVQSTCVNKSVFHFEFDIYKDGSCKEAFLLHHKVMNFQDLTTS